MRMSSLGISLSVLCVKPLVPSLHLAEVAGWVYLSAHGKGVTSTEACRHVVADYGWHFLPHLYLTFAPLRLGHYHSTLRNSQNQHTPEYLFLQRNFCTGVSVVTPSLLLSRW